MDLSGDKLALGAVALLAAVAAMSSARGGLNFSQICIKDADGFCRFCGSPTVDDKHAWGWENCQNRLPDAYDADKPGEVSDGLTDHERRRRALKVGQVWRVTTGTARIEKVLTEAEEDRYGGVVRMSWVKPPRGGEPGYVIARDLHIYELRELLEDV